MILTLSDYKEKLKQSNSGLVKLLMVAYSKWIGLGAFFDLRYKIIFNKPLKKKTSYGELKFFTPNATCYYRGRSVLKKEPETIEWLDSMKPDEILWDIGANVGCYSLYAAKKGLKVYAFEPGAANYYVLNKNIEINHLDNAIQAFCVAFSNHQLSVGTLEMPSTDLGGSQNTFGNELGESKNFKQGMMSFTVDNAIEKFSIEPPTHLKIDVDGIEDKIVQGALQTLKNAKLKSVLVELDHQDVEKCKMIKEAILNEGFKVHKHRRFKESPTAVCNYIFVR